MFESAFAVMSASDADVLARNGSNPAVSLAVGLG